LCIDLSKIFLLKTIVANSRNPLRNYMHHGCQIPTKVFFNKGCLLLGPQLEFLFSVIVSRSRQDVSAKDHCCQIQAILSAIICILVARSRKRFFLIKEILLSGPRTVFLPSAIVAGKIFCCQIPAGITLGLRVTKGRNFLDISFRMGT